MWVGGTIYNYGGGITHESRWGRLLGSQTCLNSIQAFRYSVYAFLKSILSPVKSHLGHSGCASSHKNHRRLLWVKFRLISRFGDKRFRASIWRWLSFKRMSEWHFIALFAKTKGMFPLYRRWCVIPALRQMSAVSRPFIPNCFIPDVAVMGLFSGVLTGTDSGASLTETKMHHSRDSCPKDDVIIPVDYNPLRFYYFISSKPVSSLSFFVL